MSETQPTIEAVIFDMDGLMLDTERIAQEMWQQAGREWGFDIPSSVYLEAVGRTAADTGIIFRKEFGQNFPFEAMYRRKQELLHAAIADGCIPVKVGVFELLDLLERRQIPKAVATSTARSLACLKLRSAGLMDRFSVIVCGDEVTHGKPAPDIFLAAAEKLGVAPSVTLVLEDSEAGTKAAFRAGMIPLIVPDLKAPSEEVKRLAYRVVDSLDEVSAIFSR